MRTKISQWARRLSQDRRQYFDEDIDPDLWDLLQSSSLLEIKEFDIFELAYKDWFGHAPKPHVSEAHFSNYMFNNRIPVWVRRYTRMVVELHERGELNPRQLGVYKPLPSRRLKRMGTVYTVVILGMVLYLTFIAYRDYDYVRTDGPTENLQSSRPNNSTP